MVKLKNKYVIGTHVMWFEIEMYKDFINGLLNLLETVDNKENVTIDLCFNASQKLEQVVDTEDIYKLKEKFLKGVSKIKDLAENNTGYNSYFVNFFHLDDLKFAFHDTR